MFELCTTNYFWVHFFSLLFGLLRQRFNEKGKKQIHDRRQFISWLREPSTMLFHTLLCSQVPSYATVSFSRNFCGATMNMGRTWIVKILISTIPSFNPMCCNANSLLFKCELRDEMEWIASVAEVTAEMRQNIPNSKLFRRNQKYIESFHLYTLQPCLIK